MAIYEFSKTGIKSLVATTFSSNSWRERDDLQRCLRDNIDVIAPDTLVISEEFGDWDDAKRRIDLLAIDKQANLVIIELKRTEDGGHMDLQALRYAAMISKMTFDDAERAFKKHLEKLSQDSSDAAKRMLHFLEWDDREEKPFGQDVRIVLASAEFTKEITSCVLWLNQKQIDVRCVRLKPYLLEGKLIVDVQQVIPLPEAADYQIQIRAKDSQNREIIKKAGNRDFTKYFVNVSDSREGPLAKRNAIYFVCKEICSKGVTPDEIKSLFEWRQNKVWCAIEGTLNERDFISQASREGKEGGQSFDPSRWFCTDQDLIHSNGKTYALSNQWGGDGWLRAMKALQDQYTHLDISFEPATEDDD